MSRGAIVIVATLVALSGCGVTANDASGTPSARPRSSAPRSPSPSPSPSLPAAADGTDLAACGDGRCEVVVSPQDEVPMPAQTGIPAIMVTSISPRGGVVYLASGSGATMRFTGQTAGMTSYMNDVAITTEAIVGHRAVARFTLH